MILKSKKNKIKATKTLYKNYLKILLIKQRQNISVGSGSRPLKVVFSTEKKKRNLFGNLKAPKGIESYQGFSIADDYTRAEHDMIKTWSIQAKEKNNMELNNTSH